MRATVLTGMVGLVAAGTVATSAPALAKDVDQSYWVPADGTVTLVGHGFGHGHGMSQHGAQGAALQGLTYRQIVDFYYPHTSWGSVHGKVRVLLSTDPGDDVVVRPRSGLRLHDLGDGKVYDLPDLPNATMWRLAVHDGATAVAYYTDGWHRWRPEGRRKRTLAGTGEFKARRPITLVTPSGDRSYRGRLRLAVPAPGSSDRDTVNVVTMDQYVMGVVPYEMPASWEPEALKAQAVAARTYATWSRSQNRGRYYQICDTTMCQVYGGHDSEQRSSNQAVRATRRQVLTYAGKPAFSQFSASSGGWTSSGGQPYLVAQADPYDDWSGNSVHDWSKTVNLGSLENAHPSIGKLRRLHVVQRDGNGEWDGRVWKVVLDGSQGDVSVSGDEIRSTFGLLSSWFAAEPTPIIARWRMIGGPRSVLGEVKSAEFGLDTGGAMQVFDRGRMYWSRHTGARPLTRPVLGAYRSLGGPDSRLGLPTSGPREVGAGHAAVFAGGRLYVGPRTGAVPVYTRIADRYSRYGGPLSKLGWPTHANVKTPKGERADFQNGSIFWMADTNRTVVRLSTRS